MQDSLEDFEPGVSLDRYELLLPIAKGGMGRVWAARLRGSRGFRKLVAIKTILASNSEDPSFEQMLLAEASLASQIQHPNVAQCLDLGEHDGVLYLVMEWVDGEPLDYALKCALAQGGFPLPIAVEIVAQACKGLHAAHELRDAHGAPLGLVHRDVSPQNLMVTYSGAVKLVDFGIAKATHRAPASTGSGEVKGKLSYMSPEQARGEVIDRRTDLFALGVILYLLTTGRHPYRGETPLETLRRICSNEPVVAPDQLVRGYPPALAAVVMKAIARDQHARFATADELLQALEGAAPRAGEGAVARFLQQICGARGTDRQTAIRDALLLVEGREASELTPGSEREYSSLRAVSVGRESSRARHAAVAVEPPPTPDPQRGSRRQKAVLAGVLGVIAFGGLVARASLGEVAPSGSWTSAPAAAPAAPQEASLPAAAPRMAAPANAAPAAVNPPLPTGDAARGPIPAVASSAPHAVAPASSAEQPPAAKQPLSRATAATSKRPRRSGRTTPETLTADSSSAAPARSTSPAPARDPLDRRR